MLCVMLASNAVAHFVRDDVATLAHLRRRCTPGVVNETLYRLERAAPLIRLNAAGRAAAALLCTTVLFIWLVDD